MCSFRMIANAPAGWGGSANLLSRANTALAYVSNHVRSKPEAADSRRHVRVPREPSVSLLCLLSSTEAKPKDAGPVKSRM